MNRRPPRSTRTDALLPYTTRFRSMGISWGGFNSLQVAALKPPALKAVISLASTVDRFADDIHFKGGAQLSANLSWAATVLAYQSRPPAPALAGERWRELWIERLEGEPFRSEERSVGKECGGPCRSRSSP